LDGLQQVRFKKYSIPSIYKFDTSAVISVSLWPFNFCTRKNDHLYILICIMIL